MLASVLRRSPGIRGDRLNARCFSSNLMRGGRRYNNNNNNATTVVFKQLPLVHPPAAPSQAARTIATMVRRWWASDTIITASSTRTTTTTPTPPVASSIGRTTWRRTPVASSIGRTTLRRRISSWAFPVRSNSGSSSTSLSSSATATAAGAATKKAAVATAASTTTTITAAAANNAVFDIRLAGVAAAGVFAFCTVDHLMARALTALGSRCPSPVAVIILLGTASIHPRVGAMLQSALGPGAAVLRLGLPLFLSPVILMPMAVPAPAGMTAADAPAIAALCTFTSLFTLGVSGHLAARLFRGSVPTGSLVASMTPAAMATTAAVQRALGSPALALMALVLGAAATAYTQGVHYRHHPHDNVDNHSGSSATATRAAIDEDGVAATATTTLPPPLNDLATRAGQLIPVHLGLSLALYTACLRLTPARFAMVMPPPLGAGVALGVVLYAWGGSNSVREYTEGCLPALLVPVGPAMCTLGLLPHTYRSLLRASWRPMLSVCALAGPVCLLATAALGGGYGLGLPPAVVASVLPASTTTGLALTMDVGGLSRPEWIPLGVLVCGTSGMMAWPVLLRLTALTNHSALVRGFGLGCVSHVASMAALELAGDMLAAEAAAMGFFLMGVARCLMLQIPPFEAALVALCRGGGCDGSENTTTNSSHHVEDKDKDNAGSLGEEVRKK